MSLGWYVLPRCMSSGSWDHRRPLLSSLEQMHTKTSLLMLCTLQQSLVYGQQFLMVCLKALFFMIYCLSVHVLKISLPFPWAAMKYDEVSSVK